MSVQIDKTKTHPTDGYQWIYVTIDNVDGDTCKYVTSQPFNGDSSGILSGDDLQSYVDAREDIYKTRILGIMHQDSKVPQLNGKSELESFEAWVSAGAKNAEVKKEIPAIKAKAAVYEDVEVEPAVEAKDGIPAVMGERQKELSEEEEVTKTVIEKSGSGKYLEKQVTETVVKKVPQYEEVPLYSANGKAKKDDDGNPVMHKIPKMEEYEVEPAVPAVKAKAAVTEKRLVSEAVKAVAKKELIIKPEAVIEKKAWVDTH